MVFRKNFQKITKLDPITRCITLPSVGLEFYRTKYLQDYTIGITPLLPYGMKRQYSMIADAWLDFLETKLNITILREQKIGNYYCDGYCEQSNTVYEFYGCRFHFCPHCKNPEGLIRNDTVAKKNYYLGRTFSYMEMWECQFLQVLKNNTLTKEFIEKRINFYKTIKTVGKLKIRDAFFGGRTNNLKFYHFCQEDEELCYLDFTSLYPDRVANCFYPIGHPDIIDKNFDSNLTNYFGYVKLKILPPKNLYLPVLPVLVNGKLIFPLCLLCAKAQKQIECLHNDLQRSFVGTWTTFEVQKALEKGYQIIEIYEVLNWQQKSDKLFKSYVREWLKIKQEASGWPEWISNNEDKSQYVRNYYEHEKIQLDFQNIEKNPALRSIAKLMLNSFWGKFAQRANMKQTTLCRTYDEYWKIITDPNIKVCGEILANDNLLLVNWKYFDEKFCKVGKASIAVAAMVTSYARIKLYEIMDKIESIRSGSLLYTDTDSVIFYRKKTDVEIKTSDYLGDLTNEIQNGKMVSFCSLGPKNYAYEILMPDNSTEAVLKIKGLKLTSKALEIVNFKTMVDMAVDFCCGHNQELGVPQLQFQINDRHNLTSKLLDKAFRAVSDKRCMFLNETVPWGFKK